MEQIPSFEGPHDQPCFAWVRDWFSHRGSATAFLPSLSVKLVPPHLALFRQLAPHPLRSSLIWTLVFPLAVNLM